MNADSHGSKPNFLSAKIGVNLRLISCFSLGLCRHYVVRINQRIASGLFLDSLDKSAGLFETHVLRRVRAFQIESEQIVFARLDGFQKEISLLDRIAGLSQVISAPLVAALLRFVAALGVLEVGTISDGRAMNDRQDRKSVV